MLVKKLKFFSGLIEFSVAWFKLYIISLGASDQENLTWQLPESGSQRSRSSYFTTTWSGSQRSIRSYLTTTWGMEPGIKKLVLDKLPEPGSQPSRRSHLTTTWVWEPAIKKIVLDYAAVQPINPRDKRGLKIATHESRLFFNRDNRKIQENERL